TLSFIFILGYIVFGRLVIEILGNGEMEEAYPILILMSVIIPIYSIGTILGRNSLNIHGYDNHVLYSMVLSSIVYVVVYIIFSFVFPVLFDVYLFVILYLMSFLIDTLYRFFVCKKL